MMNIYPRSYRYMHWLMAALMISQVVMGFLLSGLPRSWKGFAYNSHKIMGLILLLLFIIRLALRLRYRNLWPKPFSITRWQRVLSISVHHLMYLMMFIIPISGYFMSEFAERAPKLFSFKLSLGLVPSKFAVEVFRFIHNNGVLLFAGLITLHILAVLVHHFYWKDRLVRRMWAELK